jgi:hypothetical protein
MGVYKIRMVTTANENTFYRRLNVPRESYIDLDKEGKIILKHNSNKWKRYNSNQEEYINERKELISGLVFSNRDIAEKFINIHHSALNKYAKQNPTFSRYETFNISKKFLPSEDKLNFWSK